MADRSRVLREDNLNKRQVWKCGHKPQQRSRLLTQAPIGHDSPCSHLLGLCHHLAPRPSTRHGAAAAAALSPAAAAPEAAHPAVWRRTWGLGALPRSANRMAVLRYEAARLEGLQSKAISSNLELWQVQPHDTLPNSTITLTLKIKIPR